MDSEAEGVNRKYRDNKNLGKILYKKKRNQLQSFKKRVKVESREKILFLQRLQK